MTRTERRRRALAAAIPKESTGCAPCDPQSARITLLSFLAGSVRDTYTSDPRTAQTAGGLADREGST